ncbi:Rab-like protein 6 [Linnemannia gamsii]|uniref:Rab-like protein 6 n=1 Tax=Linnemannia gamsii TaxID=64522 RepID=A0ABQ7K6E6_9FUNG|nr:Rab-like protein 6 [Linnemannia gamsii]
MFQKLWPFNSSSQNGTSHITESQDHGVSTKVKPIHASFNRGIPLNMKIVIRGDIRTGKTSLFERLQGHPFLNEHSYRTTAQIQVANIPWQYAHTKDIIKVEVWDVVDKGVQIGDLKGPSSSSALKIENNTLASPSKSNPASDTDSAPHAAFALDASTIDVYRNTDGVILLYDISKPWTFDYAVKALADVPTNIPVLLLSNFTEDSNPRPVVSNGRVEALMKEHNDVRYKHHCAPANLIRHLDSSMKTGFGLKEIHESFGIAFLNVLRETHRKQYDQKTLEISELLQVLDKHAQDASSRRSVQKEKAPVPTSSKKAPPLPVPIQTTELNTLPQTSSPTSPARKTRNDHTNVDILSPTPVSAQTPAVLFDFNSGKLEDEFFQNVDLDSGAVSVDSQGDLSSTHPIQSIEEEQEDVDEQDINPMVARDEDIGDSSRDELADHISHQAQSPVWTPGQVEKELHSHYMVKSAEEVHVEDLQDVEDDFEPVDNDNDGNDSDHSTTESTPPFNYSLRRDSDVESQTEFPVASAMYYEQEPSGFEQQDHLPADGLDLPASKGTLSGYEKIVDDHNDNPWGSTGNLLSGVPPRSKDDRRPSDDHVEPVEDKNEDALAVNETGANDIVGLDCRKNDITVTNTDVPSAIGADAFSEEPRPSLTIQTESNGAGRKEDENEDEDGPSLRSTGTTTTPTAMTPSIEEGVPEGGDTEKRKTKKKNKKKNGKKGK